MKITRDSLGGKNNHGRMSGARSSRALSTIFHKLRKLDSKIAKLDEQIHYDRCIESYHLNQKRINKRQELDMKRKQIRLQRKGYDTAKSS